MGRSPLHANNVALAMNRQSAHVSPQFHIRYDIKFTTVKDTVEKSGWQQKAGQVKEKEKTKASPTKAKSQREVGPQREAQTNKKRKTSHVEQAQK